MRRRWSERAIDAALELDGLEPDTHQAVLELAETGRQDLASLRDDAIRRRIDRDPKLARQLIEDTAAGETPQPEWVPEMWLGFNHESFDRIDERTERRLRFLLTAEQFKTLPRRTPGDAAK